VDAVFSSCMLLSVVAFLIQTQVPALRAGLVLGYGVFTPYTDRNNCPMLICMGG
jgi:hypothetical protein